MLRLIKLGIQEGFFVRISIQILDKNFHLLKMILAQRRNKLAMQYISQTSIKLSDLRSDRNTFVKVYDMNGVFGRKQYDTVSIFKCLQIKL